MAYEVYLKKNEEKRPLAGHSWVYANEVARIEGKDKNGALATVRSFDGRFVGKGYLNHASKILVRLFIRGNEEDGERLWEERIAAAWLLRKNWATATAAGWSSAKRTTCPRSSWTNMPTYSSSSASPSAYICAGK